MQAEYYPFNQGPPVMMPQMAQQFYGGYLPFAYPIGQTLPTHKNVEKLKRNKKNASTDSGRKFEEVTNSTDESIHLVRSRKTGESAPTRYDAQEAQKKRSQSGNSLVKDCVQQQEDVLLSGQRHRSHSDDRSISPNNSASNGSRNASNNHISSDSASQKGKSKRRKDRKHRKNQWQYSDFENRVVEQYFVPSSPYNVLPMQFGGQCCTPTNYQYQGGPSQQEAWCNEYNASIAAQQQQQQQPTPSYIQQQQQQQQDYYGSNPWQQVQQSGYDAAPGAPMPITIECTQYPGCVQAPGPQQYDPCCYPQQQQPAPYYQQQQECYPQEQYGQPPSNSYQCFDVPQQPGLPPGAKIVAEYFLGYLDDQQTQQYCQQYPAYPPPQTSSESSKEEVEVERWEKPKKQDSFSEYEEDRRCKDDDLKRLKDDIIKTIQNELGNLKLDSRSDPIQPIFLMPKASEASQQKPIYIPRNIYVPVIRPVFVPRERIIVRPQIIHVARPVLVDRPVPIQQRPIVIERDRPVPVRVETIEKTEPIGSSCNELTRNIETGQEVTYHEFTQTYPNANGEYTTSTYQYNDQLDYDENRRKQQQSQSSTQQQHDVMSLIEEAERRKNLASKSNEDIYSKYGQQTQSKTLESVLGGQSQGYTLEVLDQRISDKFEKTDQETIKARYGVDSYQYLPPGSELINQPTNTGGTSNSNNRQQVSSSEFYTNQNLGHSGSYKSLASVNNETRISNSNLYGNYSNQNESNQIIYGNSSTSPRTSLNQQSQNVQNILKSYGSYSNDQPLSEN